MKKVRFQLPPEIVLSELGRVELQEVRFLSISYDIEGETDLKYILDERIEDVLEGLAWEFNLPRKL